VRLLLVIPTLSSYEAFLSDFSDAAITAGHEVHVATRLERLAGCGASKLETTPVTFHAIEFARGANPVALWKSARQLRQLVQQIQPDWIQAHFSVAALVAGLAKTKVWPYTDCIIQGLACTLARGHARTVAWLGERFAMLRLDAMWVLTSDDFDVVQRWNAAKARIQTAPGFGCRLGRFDSATYTAAQRSERRVELGISEQDTVLVFVGRLAAFKGFDRTVRAFNQLCERGAPVRLLVLGTFDALHPSGLSEAEVQTLETNSRIIMAGWQANVADWLSIADLCVFPSEREGMPVCLMESLSMGVPVITANSRGCRDVVRNGVDGLVLEDSSETALAVAIGELLEDPSQIEAMKTTALKGRDRFDRKHYITEQFESLETVLDGLRQVF
jgi:glycosyltransferase involved in cell wall biosynthesis